jgi:methylated-DNA-[protein]-cysteine S-methyltransferase
MPLNRPAAVHARRQKEPGSRSHDLTGRSVYLVQEDREEMTMETMKQAPVSAAATHTTIASRLGDLTVVARDGAVTGLYFPHHWYMPDRAGFGERSDVRFGDVREQLGRYLAGDRRRFDVPVRAHGDKLQERVWDLVSQISYGETVTYGELARDLGDGTTAQEVGAAVGRNPVCILIPCHRVVGAGGKLTGFAGGLQRKRFLLDLERDVARPPSRLF